MLDKRSCLRGEAATVWTPRDAIEIHLEVEPLKIERHWMEEIPSHVSKKFEWIASIRGSVSLDTRLVGYAAVSDSLCSSSDRGRTSVSK